MRRNQPRAREQESIISGNQPEGTKPVPEGVIPFTQRSRYDPVTATATGWRVAGLQEQWGWRRVGQTRTGEAPVGLGFFCLEGLRPAGETATASQDAAPRRPLCTLRIAISSK